MSTLALVLAPFWWLLFGLLTVMYKLDPACYTLHDDTFGSRLSLLIKHCVFWPVALRRCRTECSHRFGHSPCAFIKEQDHP